MMQNPAMAQGMMQNPQAMQMQQQRSTDNKPN